MNIDQYFDRESNNEDDIDDDNCLHHQSRGIPGQREQDQPNNGEFKSHCNTVSLSSKHSNQNIKPIQSKEFVYQHGQSDFQLEKIADEDSFIRCNSNPNGP